MDEIENDYFKDCLDVRVGDVVIAINGTDVELATTEQLVDMLLLKHEKRVELRLIRLEPSVPWG